MKRIFRLVLFILFSFIAYNCSDNKCNESVDVELKAEIIVKDTILENANFIDSLSIYSPLWLDSVHYSSINYLLDLSPFSNTTTFIFTSQLWKDTVWILHERQLVYLSQECGFVNYYTIDSAWYTSNNIDSIEWVNKKLTTQNDGHLKIYF